MREVPLIDDSENAQDDGHYCSKGGEQVHVYFVEFLPVHYQHELGYVLKDTENPKHEMPIPNMWEAPFVFKILKVNAQTPYQCVEHIN